MTKWFEYLSNPVDILFDFVCWYSWWWNRWYIDWY